MRRVAPHIISSLLDELLPSMYSRNLCYEALLKVKDAHGLRAMHSLIDVLWSVIRDEDPKAPMLSMWYRAHSINGENSGIVRSDVAKRLIEHAQQRLALAHSNTLEEEAESTTLVDETDA